MPTNQPITCHVHVRYLIKTTTQRCLLYVSDSPCRLGVWYSNRSGDPWAGRSTPLRSALPGLGIGPMAPHAA